MDAFRPFHACHYRLSSIGHRGRLPVLRRLAEFGSQPLPNQKDQAFDIDRVFLMNRNLHRTWRKIVVDGCLRFEVHQQAGYGAHLVRTNLNGLRGRWLPGKSLVLGSTCRRPKSTHACSMTRRHIGTIHRIQSWVRQQRLVEISRRWFRNDGSRKSSHVGIRRRRLWSLLRLDCFLVFFQRKTSWRTMPIPSPCFH